MKTTCSRTRQLEIAASLYGLAKGSRAIYCLEKNPQSRIRGVRSSSQVIGVKDGIWRNGSERYRKKLHSVPE